jgi:hypothetical protein
MQGFGSADARYAFGLLARPDAEFRPTDQLVFEAKVHEVLSPTGNEAYDSHAAI